MKPNFQIIGAQKAGTTSLLRYLAAHPDIFVPDEKEITAFYADANYNKRFDKYPYEKYYQSWKDEKYAGNSPANLLYFSNQTAAKIHAYNPEMKLIAILRNPIDRAYSAYWYFVRNGFENESFESALRREKQILSGGNLGQMADFTYVSHGFYYEQLTQFLKIFSKDQFLILLFDDMKKNPKSVLNKVYKFFDIKKCYPEDMLDKKFNEGAKSRVQVITNLIYQDHILKKIYKRAVPAAIRQYASTTCFKRIRDLNLSTFAYPPMETDTRETLINIFEEHNKKLANLINRDLSHWR